MNDWEFLDGDYGRYVRRGGPKKRSAESTPGYTPTTNSSHLPRPHPDLYEAAVNGHGNQLVALKTVGENDQDCLLREFQALNKLTGLDCVPKIREFNYDHGLAFIAFEFLGEEWVSLDKDIQTSGSFKERLHGDEQFFILRNSLEKAIVKLHGKGVVHGDLKSNHIFIKKKYEQNLEDSESALDYSIVKIVDFGASYLIGETSKWRGGSIGFSNPYHWNHEHRDGLQFSELQAIDWYSTYAILFHVYTGECFPVASPAFRLFINPKIQPEVKEYYRQLETGLHAKLGGEEILVDIVSYLCNPSDFEYPGKLPNKPIFANLKFNFQSGFPLLVIFFLFGGHIIQSRVTILESTAGAIIFSFFFILVGSNTLVSQGKANIRNLSTNTAWFVTALAVIGIFFINSLTLLSETHLFPLIFISTIFAIGVIVFSSPLLPKPIDPLVEGLLLFGILASINIPYSLLGILPIASGIIFSFKIVNRNLSRVCTYSFVSLVAVYSWAILEVQGARFYTFGLNIPHLADESLLLLNMLIWFTFGEISIRSTYHYRKNQEIKNFIWRSVLLALAALIFQALIQ